MRARPSDSPGSRRRPWRPGVGRALRAAGELAGRTLRECRHDRIAGLAAEVAFFAFLAIPSLLSILVGVAGYVARIFGLAQAADVRGWLVRTLGGSLAPEVTADLVGPAVEAVLARGRWGVASVGVIGALWSGSRLSRVLIEVMNVAYDLDEWRPAWRRRVLALGLTAGGLAVLALVLPLLAAGPRLGHALELRLGLGGILGLAWEVLYWPVTLLAGTALLTSFYHVAPAQSTPWRRDLPGAVLAVAGWLAAAAGLRVYVRFAIREAVFGPLAAPAVLLLWLYASALVVLVGAELNAEVGRLWPRGRPSRSTGSARAPEQAPIQRSARADG